MAPNLSKYTDRELLKLLNNSNLATSETAFAEIYSRYSARVYAYCLKVMVYEDDANDVFQESFISFYQSRNKLEITEAKIMPYILRVCRNSALNFKRSIRVYDKLEENMIIEENTVLEDREIVEIVSKGLSSLEFEDREIIVLRQFQGLSFTEIATITNQTIGALRMRFFRAKDRLRRILSPYYKEISEWEIHDDLLS